MKWNNVTKCSRWMATLVFFVLLPVLSFFIGRQYERTILDISDVEEIANASARMYYTSEEYRIRIEFPAAWKSYDVVEVKEAMPWYSALSSLKALQFYAPTNDPAYQAGDPNVTAPVIRPENWSERKAGKALVFELLIFPTKDWEKMQAILKKGNTEGDVLAKRISHSFAGKEYAYIFLGQDKYPEDIIEYLYLPSVRDIKILRLTKK